MRQTFAIALAALVLAGCAAPDPGQVRAGKPSLAAGAPHHGPGTPVSRHGGR